MTSASMLPMAPLSPLEPLTPDEHIAALLRRCPLGPDQRIDLLIATARRYLRPHLVGRFEALGRSEQYAVAYRALQGSLNLRKIVAAALLATVPGLAGMPVPEPAVVVL